MNNFADGKRRIHITKIWIPVFTVNILYKGSWEMEVLVVIG
ncbi:hypothetical protein [Chryseobacterium tongliaoense]